MLGAPGLVALAFLVFGARPGCAGDSQQVWMELFDATGGRNWKDCADTRLNPCACASYVSCRTARGERSMGHGMLAG